MDPDSLLKEDLNERANADGALSAADRTRAHETVPPAGIGFVVELGVVEILAHRPPLEHRDPGQIGRNHLELEPVIHGAALVLSHRKARLEA